MSNRNEILVISAVAGVLAIALIMGLKTGARNKNLQRLIYPLENGKNRPQLLTFGLYVTPDPQNNPINPPERFTGFHTALDFEILPEELEKEVPVYAVCEGRTLFSGTADGYGGVLVHSCNLGGQKVTVLYGHLDPGSLTKKVRGSVKTGDKLGILGDHKTQETGDTRKHLHFGIHKGTKVEFKGYVENRDELNNFIDPRQLLEN